MSTDLNKLFNAMNRNDVFAITDQLFPRRAAATREPSSFAPAEGSSPAADTGTAGVGVLRLNPAYERFIAQLHELLSNDRFDEAHDLVRAEHLAIHGR